MSPLSDFFVGDDGQPFWSRLMDKLSPDMAIDLGTANTLIYVKGHGVVLNEPSVVALEEDRGIKRVLAVGREAKAMLGRTPENVRAVRPLRDGVIADFRVAEEMIQFFVNKASSGSSFLSPRVIVCVPSGSTPVERRAIEESVAVSGARKVFMIEEPVAAAIGVGLPIGEARGSMVVDIGGGTTEVAIIALNGIAYSCSVRVGGDVFDEAIVHYAREKHQLLIGDSTAERVKLSIASAVMPKSEHDDITDKIRGRDVISGIPQEMTIKRSECAAALQSPLNEIINALRHALEATSPELSADIIDQGMVITGGGALLHGLDRFLYEKTRVNVTIADEPLLSVVKGGGLCLESPLFMRTMLIRNN